jgi:DNA primase
VPGRIRDESIAAVRERAHIDQVIREYVTLRPAGGGSLKGLCPFHDEKTPSFQVTPGRGFFHCFGCQKGGDVISFVMEIDQLTFGEAVERLAGKVGVELRYDESGRPVGGAASRNREQRTRFAEASRDAARYFTERLADPDAAAGRQFLAERGFDLAAIERFGVGYAPRDGEALRRHLRGRGYSDEELLGAGLVAVGRGTPYDRFRGRLMWPIRDLLGDVVGFGARRLHDDDRIEAKYLNTPETVLYRKSQVLYGVDLAKRDIARRSQAVVVEGYTDVMACHLAGVTTAVATCGTAFGDDHARVLRRLLMDQDEYRGEVIFTFDGDAAGQRAALRAFEGDQRFVAQTYVAIEPDGLDPCEVRQKKGDAAVRELVARRQPLFQFAVRTMLAEHDLDAAEGRTRALERTIPLIARIREVALRDEYARRLAGWVGAPDELDVVRRVRAAAGGGRGRGSARGGGGSAREAAQAAGQQAMPIVQHGEVDAATLGVEREVLKAALQRPALAGPAFDALADDAFRSPAHAAVHAAIRAGGPVATQPGGPGWVTAVAAACPDDAIRALVTELSVEPLTATEDEVPLYVESVTLRLQEMWVSRRLVSLKARLQRTDPEAEPEVYNRTFADLMALEQHRRTLRERAIGGL